jgi:pyruvate/2-oxoglutarate dehydrogenase complex dihydrolipoamide dehydrogenase (E3) component
MIQRKDELIEDFASFRRQQLSAGKFSFLRAKARFENPHCFRLDDGRAIAFQHAVVATGSSVAPPPISGMAEAGFITSDDAIRMTRFPKSLAILGGGAVAVEFAQFFARFGVEVIQLQRSSQLLRDFDADVSGEIEKTLRREGVDLITSARIDRIHRTDRGKSIRFTTGGEHREIVVDEVLHALGREANTASLHLGNAGITTHGTRILTGADQRTTQSHIYAAGDCCGPHEIVHIAIQQGEIAAHNILHPTKPRQTDYRLLLTVVFSDPQVACVGLTEKTARNQGVPFIAAQYPFTDHGKSMILGAKEGFVKLLASPETGEILGGACVGPQGGELIHEIVVTMAKRMTVAELAQTPHYHPTLAEIWTYPAEELAEKVDARTRN